MQNTICNIISNDVNRTLTEQNEKEVMYKSPQKTLPTGNIPISFINNNIYFAFSIKEFL